MSAVYFIKVYFVKSLEFDGSVLFHIGLIIVNKKIIVPILRIFSVVIMGVNVACDSVGTSKNYVYPIAANSSEE